MSERETDELLQDDSLDGVERALLQGEGAHIAVDDVPVDRVAARAVVQRFQAHERKRRMLVAGGSVLALAAAAALVVGLARQPGGAAVAKLTPAQSSSLVLESGKVSSAAGVVALGQPVAAGVEAQLAPGACLRAGGNVRLCSAQGAKLKLPALGKAWDIELTSGAVTADLGEMPSGFTIRTLHGSVAVVGTLFSVELDAAHEFTTVTVERGRVKVHSAFGQEASVIAGEVARLGAGLQLSGRGHEVSELPIPLAPSEGVAPVPAAPEHAAPGRTSPGNSAGELLEQARQERAGRHYAEAARSYRKLVQQHPESAEARAALVSLGQLELGQLGQPEAALRSFQAYLAHPGQLRQEAEHGAIVALQKLGRRAEERRAIEGFLQRYPKSTQAGPLGQRLKQL